MPDIDRLEEFERLLIALRSQHGEAALLMHRYMSTEGGCIGGWAGLHPPFQALGLYASPIAPYPKDVLGSIWFTSRGKTYWYLEALSEFFGLDEVQEEYLFSDNRRFYEWHRPYRTITEAIVRVRDVIEGRV